MSLRDDLATHNERVKMFAGVLNAVGLGFIGFAVLRPLTDTAVPVSWQTLLWGGVGLALHAAAHHIPGMVRKQAANDRL